MKSLNCGDLSLSQTQMSGISLTSSKTLWTGNKMSAEKEEAVLVKAPQGTTQQKSRKLSTSLIYVIAFSELLACSPNTHTHTSLPPWASFPVLALPFLFKAFGKIIFHFTLLPLSLEGLQKGSQNEWAEGSWIWIGKFWPLVISSMVTFSFKQSRKHGFSLHCSVSF